MGVAQRRWVILFSIAVGVLPLSVPSWANGAEIETGRVFTGRYSITSTNSPTSVTDPLQAVVSITFPKNVTNIGDATRHLLKLSGYRLVANAHDSTPILLNLPLPETQRVVGPATVAQVLQVLAGQAFDVIVDPVHRLISFDIKSDFAAFTATTETTVPPHLELTVPKAHGQLQ